MTKTPTSTPSDSELIADALNEQGYLLQLRLLTLVNTAKEGEAFPPWRIDAVEYPVSTANGDQTRIDIVLTHMKFPGIHLAVESKRANPLYKRWVFFDQTVRPNSKFFFDIAEQFSKRTGEGMRYVRRLDQRVATTEVYTFYLEALQNRPNSQKRSSATDAIEDAFRQVTVGQVGLMRKLIRFGDNMVSVPVSPTLVIPVVVTTAQLFVAGFGHDAPPLETAMLHPKDLVLMPKPFVAVNYRLGDDVTEMAGLTSNGPTDIPYDLATQQVRTVFVVHSTHLREFLFWADNKLVDP